MQIAEVTKYLETIAPLSLQEGYDNAGLITGSKEWNCTGIITCLDATEEVIIEAVEKKCNLVVAHHPVIFSGLKKINGSNYVEKAVIAAIKNDVAIYAIHTNLDNIKEGVNRMIADKIGLRNCAILQPKKGLLKKLVTFVPIGHAEKVKAAIFEAGAGQIGNYTECSFNISGDGTFKAGLNTNAFVGEIGKRHTENETRIETIFPAWLQGQVIAALIKAHPYEEVAYDIYPLDNQYAQTGAGLIGELEKPVSEADFLNHLKNAFNLSVIRHTPLPGKMVKKVALCGGAGSFLTGVAASAAADFYITGDVKYHEFFDADNKLVLADIGHYESEQFTIDLLFDILKEKFPTFASRKTGVNTNPVRYF